MELSDGSANHVAARDARMEADPISGLRSPETFKVSRRRLQAAFQKMYPRLKD